MMVGEGMPVAPAGGDAPGTLEGAIRARFRAPRAAAVAGIVFSCLFMVSLVLVWRSVPADPLETGEWLSRDTKTLRLALNLVPFSGIAFLWFMAVLRDRFGADGDRFFDTVFLGSGFLFVAMLFSCVAVAVALVVAHGMAPDRLAESGTYAFGRIMAYQIMRIFAMKMAGVFMILTSKLSLRAGIVPRWTAFLGFSLALALLLAPDRIQWLPLIFPLWILLMSIQMLRKPVKP